MLSCVESLANNILQPVEKVHEKVLDRKGRRRLKLAIDLQQATVNAHIRHANEPVRVFPMLHTLMLHRITCVTSTTPPHGTTPRTCMQ